MKREIISIREKFSHMGSHSGYDQLFNVFEKGHKNEIELKSIWKEDKLLGRLEQKLYFKLKSLTNSTSYYSSNSFKAELEAFFQLLIKNPDVFHISYLENNFGFGKWYSKLSKTKIIATVHQPPSWWQSGFADPALVSMLDQLIVLDTPSKEYFSNYIDHNKIEIIKHGVDTDFFKPSGYTEQSRSIFNCLFTGQWLRDIEFLAAVVEYINSKKDVEINFHIVYPFINHSNKTALKKLNDAKNTFFYTNISDNYLKSLYQSSDIFLVPLIDCTANNSILEAMACGLPIVTTPVGGVFEYVTEDFAFLSSSAQQAGNHIIELSKNPLEVKRQGVMARRYTETNLSWNLIADSTIKAYKI